MKKIMEETCNSREHVILILKLEIDISFSYKREFHRFSKLNKRF